MIVVIAYSLCTFKIRKKLFLKSREFGPITRAIYVLKITKYDQMRWNKKRRKKNKNLVGHKKIYCYFSNLFNFTPVKKVIFPVNIGLFTFH